ncbi:MAG: transcriptional regulator, AraC family [Moraxellaceae bacterium]|jgi:AraC-like DNA-binding protein|nr:transcriptional regulator, AraC family [Moraxellaceae bacterium]
MADAGDAPAERDDWRTGLPAWTAARNQPSTYSRAFTEAAAAHGLPRATVLARAGLPADLLEDPAGRVSFVEILQVLATVQALADDDALGFESGVRLPLTAHGSLGYALMCAPTPRQALGILQRFWHLRGRGMVLQVHDVGDMLFLELLPELTLPNALRDFLLPSILTSMWQGVRFVIPALPAQAEIWLPGAEPRSFARYRERLPTVRFGMPAAGIRLVGDKAPLDTPLPTANPEGLVQALAACERESALLGDVVDPVLARSRALLQLGAAGFPGPEAIAEMLHMTPRTFRRRLQELGLSYKQLLEEARRRDSCALLERPEMEVRRVAELLGYSDPANFTRAFRQWTGMAPREWRLARAEKPTP